MIRTILFDFGNVVAFFDHDRAVRRLLPHTDRTAEELWRLFYTDDLEDRFESGQVSTDELIALARDKGGIRCDRAEFFDAFVDIFWPNPPMEDLIPRLKANGYRLVLASNTNAAHYERYREQFRDLLAYFDAIAVSHEAGARKPHPRFFEYAHRLAECEKAECLFVDDLMANVTGAREFGWNAIRYTRFDRLVHELRAAGAWID
jgi:glucose-1-phosphatase